MKPGQIAVVFEPVACGKINKEINKVGTIWWVSDDKVSVLFDDNFIFTGDKKSAKVIKNREEQEAYVSSTSPVEYISKFDSELCDD